MSLIKNIGLGKEVFNPFLYVGDSWYEQLVKYDMVPTKEDLGANELSMWPKQIGRSLFLHIDVDDKETTYCSFDAHNHFITVDNNLKKYLNRLQSYYPSAHFVDSFVYLQWRLSYKEGT